MTDTERRLLVDTPMQYQECKTQAVSRSRFLRVIHFLLYGHATHTCERKSLFAGEHAGSHVCHCGYKIPKIIVRYDRREQDISD